MNEPIQVFDGDGEQRLPRGNWRFSWDAPYSKDNFCEARYLNVYHGTGGICAIDFETDKMQDLMGEQGELVHDNLIEDEVTNLLITKGYKHLLEDDVGFGISLRLFLKHHRKLSRS